MDKKVQKKKDRAKEVKKKVLRKRMEAREVKKDLDLQEKLKYETRTRKMPVVNNFLTDNIAALEKKEQAFEDMMKQREEAKNNDENDD